MTIQIRELLIATRNGGKLGEFRNLLSGAGWRVVGLTDLSIDKDFEETGSTFAENARLKAVAYSAEIELPVLADDSGLEVAALGGRPGIFSARYAGPGASDAERIRKLLAEMNDAKGGRDARFVCALALARNGEVLLECQGECAGIIADSPRGTHGFGYDPVFLFPKLGKTYAELTDSEKNRHSHRAHAVSALLETLAARTDNRES
jgi:XTP/dITP diphosphohydrolase